MLLNYRIKTCNENVIAKLTFENTMHNNAIVAYFLIDFCENHTNNKRTIARTLITRWINFLIVTLSQLSIWFSMIRIQWKNIETQISLFIWIKIAIKFWKCVTWKSFSLSKNFAFISIVIRRKIECFSRNCVVRRFRNYSLLIAIFIEVNFIYRRLIDYSHAINVKNYHFVNQLRIRFDE